MNLFTAIETAAKITRGVLVSYSGGKDSAAVLDLCCKHFDRVEAFLMYYVKGLSFQVQILNWARAKYGITIHEVPHFELSEMLAGGLYRMPDVSSPMVKVSDVYAYMRKLTGLHWIAGGETINNSIWRRAMIKHSSAIDEKRGRFYPIAYWSKARVLDYLRLHRLKYDSSSKVLGHSFGSLGPEDLFKIKKHYPRDYDKIKTWFPLADAGVRNYELTHADEISEVRDPGD